MNKKYLPLQPICMFEGYITEKQRTPTTHNVQLINKQTINYNERKKTKRSFNIFG